MRQNIQECTEKNMWNTAFKKLEVVWPVLTYHITSNFYVPYYIPQILLGPLLNILFPT